MWEWGRLEGGRESGAFTPAQQEETSSSRFQVDQDNILEDSNWILSLHFSRFEPTTEATLMLG